MALSISKYLRAWINPTFQSSESSNEEKWNDFGPVSETSRSIKHPRPETPLALRIDSKILKREKLFRVTFSSTQ